MGLLLIKPAEVLLFFTGPDNRTVGPSRSRATGGRWA
jgi:hypothetical protein